MAESTTQKRRVAVLGSTGSIGRQTLEICAKEPERLEVVGLAAHSSVDRLIEQAKRFGVSTIALSDQDAAQQAKAALASEPITVLDGSEGVIDLLEMTDPDIVVNALVGAAGLRATIATLKAGKVLALANKESLVAGGEIVMPLVDDGKLLPVDSEHSALFQCLLGEDSSTISRLWLTASGGPFRTHTRAQLAHITPQQALAHPTWNMGAKITIDSSTMMNKGLEVIEAHHLFGIDYDDIEVVIHPQSVIHSMVEYSDGAVLAHLGPTDMRLPIQYAFSYPRRWSAPLEPLDMTQLSDLTFEAPQNEVFPLLGLAYEAGRAGGSAPVILNAANEVAVDAFLKGGLPFLGIADIVDKTLSTSEQQPISSITDIELIDAAARQSARQLLG
ncbi:MAG: 1-deoxy-D-xylulose-5-phosphate reductoisomerase [Actinomycetia bacterium]|nr:1-deoxy-D-xylulose-5-phosphate reductoisomerase [Actinomycetes bacterium]